MPQESPAFTWEGELSNTPYKFLHISIQQLTLTMIYGHFESSFHFLRRL